MGDVAVMQVQEVRRVVVRFKNREIFLTKMPVLKLATVESEEKGIIRIIGIEKIQGAEVKSVIAGNCRKKCIEKVGFLFVELGIVNTEDLIELGACAVHLRRGPTLDNDGEGKLAALDPLELDFLDPHPQLQNL